MPNRVARQVPVAGFDPKAVLPEGLAEVRRPGGESFDQISKAAADFASHIGRYADEAAKVEGAAEGVKAGLDPGYRPEDRTTIRGRAFDAAATKTYAYGLDTWLRLRMDEIYQANKDSPAALKEAFDQYGGGGGELEGELFPAVAGPSRRNFALLRRAYESKAGEALDRKVTAQALTAWQDNLAARSASLDRAVYGATVDASSGELIAGELTGFERTVRAGVADGHISPYAGRRMIAEATERIAGAVVTGAYDGLPDLDAKEKFIDRLDRDFLAGKGPVAGIDAKAMRALKTRLVARLKSDAAAAAKAEDAADKADLERSEKAGYKRLAEGTLDRAWLDEHAEALSAPAYRRLSQAISPRRAGGNDPQVYSDLLLQAEDDPETAIKGAVEAYRNGALDRRAFDRVYGAAARGQADDKAPWAKEMRRDILRRLKPSDYQDSAEAARQLDGAFAFDDWLAQNPQATREQARDEANALVDRFTRTAHANERTQLPMPRFAAVARAQMTIETLPAIADRLRKARAAGTVTERDFLAEVDNLRRWQDLLGRAPARKGQ